VDDNDKQQPLERNKENVEENDWIAVVYSGKWYVGPLSDNDLCILHSYFVLRRQYIAGHSTIRSLCIFALD
jgi:hypothetical protein